LTVTAGSQTLFFIMVMYVMFVSCYCLAAGSWRHFGVGNRTHQTVPGHFKIVVKSWM